MKAITHFTLVTLLLLFGLPANAQGMLDQIRSNQAITIAHRDSSIPFSYLDADQKPVGYAMDLCLKVVDALRRELKMPALKVNYLSVTSATRIPSIVQGKAAMECGSTTNTAERRKQVDYTIAHFISSARFLVRNDAGLLKLEDLNGRNVVSTKGSTNIKTLERIKLSEA